MAPLDRGRTDAATCRCLRSPESLLITAVGIDGSTPLQSFATATMSDHNAIAEAISVSPPSWHNEPNVLLPDGGRFELNSGICIFIDQRVGDDRPRPLLPFKDGPRSHCPRLNGLGLDRRRRRQSGLMAKQHGEAP